MFIILSNPRSGSHLLGELLDGHPQLECYGELAIKTPGLLRGRERKQVSELGENEGAIYHYSQFLESPHRGVMKNAKIIHLIRNDLRAIVRSGYLLGREEVKAHYYEDTTIEANELTEEEIQRGVDYVKRQRITALNHCSNSDIFTISYEMLTGNKTLSVFTKERNTPLLNFLGVEPMDLTTNLKKPKYVWHSGV